MAFATISAVRGAALDQPFTPDSGEASPSLAGLDLRFVVSSRFGTDELLELTSADADQIEITNAAGGLYTVHLTAANTLAVGAGIFRWEVWITTAGAERRLAQGTFLVSEATPDA